MRSNGALPTCSRIGVGLNLRLDDESWINREVLVQFWEGVGLRCPALLTYLGAYDRSPRPVRALRPTSSFTRMRFHQALGYRTRARSSRRLQPVRRMSNAS